MNPIVVLPILLVIVLSIWFKFVKSRELLGDAIIISSGIILAFLFAEFAFYGKIYAWEPSRYIAGAELVLTIFITILGLERFWNDLQGEPTS